MPTAISPAWSKLSQVGNPAERPRNCPSKCPSNCQPLPLCAVLGKPALPCDGMAWMAEEGKLIEG